MADGRAGAADPKVGAAGLTDQRTLRLAAGPPAVAVGGADQAEPGGVWLRGRSALAPPSS